MKIPRFSALPVALLAAALALAGSPARAADPFYENLFQDGVEALERGDADTAIRKLEIATFGLLEDPPHLAEGLAHLALAHQAAGDTVAFRDTFRRVIELEQDFQAYTQAVLTDETREQLGSAAVRLMPRRALEGTPFAALLEAQAEKRIAALPAKQRLPALEKQADDFPEDPRWPAELAKLEIELGHEKEALEWADKAAGLGVDLPCARLAALSELKRDDEAVSEVAHCQTATSELLLAKAALHSWARLDRWQEAADFLATLPEELLADNNLTRLAHRIERKAPSDEADAETPESELEIASTDTAGGEPKDEGGSNELDPGHLTEAETAALQEAREILRTARLAQELRVAADLVGPIAHAHPDHAESQQLAGEIAYRAARWQEAADYFRQGGDPGDERPALLFYMAVAYFESGDPEAAKTVLARCLPRLHRTPYVDRYIERILGEG